MLQLLATVDTILVIASGMLEITISTKNKFVYLLVPLTRKVVK